MDPANVWFSIMKPYFHDPLFWNHFTLQIDKKGCGETKGCYSLPSNCAGSGDCTYLFTYNVSGRNVIIDMSAKERWVAVAFNENKLMVRGNTIENSAYLCVFMIFYVHKFSQTTNFVCFCCSPS